MYQSRFKVIVSRILAMYTMGTIFLPFVFLNIPEPYGRTYFVFPIWIFFILLYQPKLLFSKYINIFYLFFVILFLGSFLLWNNKVLEGGRYLNFTWIFTDIYGAYIAILMYLWFLKENDLKGIQLVTKITIAFIVLTSITTIRGIDLYPDAVRLMASTASISQSDMLMKIGIGTYSFFASFIFIAPVILYSMRFDFSVKKTIYILIIITLPFYSLILSGFTTALLLTALFFFYSFFAKRDLKKSYRNLIIVLFISFFVLNGVIAEVFYLISEFSISSELQYRLRDVGRVFELRDFDPGSDKTYFAQSRLALSFLSLTKFFENPFWGGGWGGGHSTWLDRLGFFGILGFFPWVIIVSQQIQLNMKIFDIKFKPYYTLSFFSLFVLGILTTTATSYQAMASIFFLVPGIYLLKHSLNIEHIDNTNN